MTMNDKPKSRRFSTDFGADEWDALCAELKRRLMADGLPVSMQSLVRDAVRGAYCDD